MMKLLSTAAMLLGAALLAPSMHAGARAKDAEAPKAPPSSSQVVLAQWNEIGRKLIAMAEDFPEDKYDYKPTQPQRTFAEQLLHMAGSTYFFTNVALGQKPPTEEDPSRERFKTKADVVAFVKKAFEDGAAAIKSKGDKGMNEWVTDADTKQQMQISDLAYELIEHSGEHYGQLVVYYRLAGLVPPESRPKK